MDVLKDKKYKSYDYVSRYSSFPYYYHTLDKKNVYGTTAQLNQDITFVIHKVRTEDTLDSLSLIYYGRPDYYWIIADYNKIQDPYLQLSDKFESIKIPQFSSIKYVK